MLPDSDMAEQPKTVHEVGSRPQLIHCQNCKKEVMTVIELITNGGNVGFDVLGSLLCLCNCALSDTSYHGGNTGRDKIIHSCPTCKIQLGTYKLPN